jgi:hypothetical protein
MSSFALAPSKIFPSLSTQNLVQESFCDKKSPDDIQKGTTDLISNLGKQTLVNRDDFLSLDNTEVKKTTIYDLPKDIWKEIIDRCPVTTCENLRRAFIREVKLENLGVIDEICRKIFLCNDFETFHFFLKNKQCLEKCGHLTKKLNISHYHIFNHELKQIIQKCPNLEELEIKVFAKGKVQTLSTATEYRNFDIKQIFPLPQSLSSLTCFTKVFDDALIAELPSHLESLTITEKISLDPSSTFEKLKERPLKKLSIILEIATDNFLLNLPRNLSSFSLEIDNPLKNETIALLSSYPLKELKFIESHHTSLATPELIESLPRTLESLAIMGNLVTNESVVKLPPLLLYLKLEGHYMLTKEIVQNLPRSLISLDLGKQSYTNFNDISVLKFPPELRILRGYNPLTDEGIKNLPRTLEILDVLNQNLDIPNHNFGRPDHKEKDNITNQGLDHLPRKLKELYLWGNCELTGKGFENLPPNLDKLLVMDFGTIKDNEISFLPKTLKTLIIFENDGFLTDSSIPQFPRSLELLALRNFWVFREQSCSLFPPNLKYLCLYSLEIGSDGITLLPKTLRKLYLPRSKVKLDALLQFPYLQEICMRTTLSSTTESDAEFFITKPEKVKFSHTCIKKMLEF